MKVLDLYRLWEVCSTLSLKESELQEKNIFTSFMGYKSKYSEISFENFLDYYSFKIEDDKITVFNNDGIPYEDFFTDDFSYIPTVLLSFSNERLENWMKVEVDLQLEKQRRDKLADKERIKQQIENLKTQLNNL